MPWIAIHEGKKKGAFQVPKQTDVECPTCGERMRVWSESTDGKARHFKHIGNMGENSSEGGTSSCEAVAESDKHIKWKNFAAETLKVEFLSNINECSVEKELDAPVSDKNRRVGDAVLLFETTDPQLGEGVVIEVQHKNVSKDIYETTRDYINQNLSVVWTDKSDFSNEHCKLIEVDIRKRARNAVWPDHVPEHYHWTKPYYNFQSQQKNWIDVFNKGLVESGAPATLPPEYCDQKARELWESKRWHELFDERHGLYLYEADNYINNVQQSLSDGPETTVRLPPDWCDETAHSLWKSKNWDFLFTTFSSERLNDFSLNIEYQYEVYTTELKRQLSLDTKPNVASQIPLLKWLQSEDNSNHYKKLLRQDHQRGADSSGSESLVVYCNNCDTATQSLVHGGVHHDMVQYSTMEYCRNCETNSWHSTGVT